MSTPRAITAALALLVAACSAAVTGPPEIVVDRTACSHCGMFVSEPTYAAAYQAQGQAARVFDDIGCMMNALRRDTTTPAAVWVQDAAGTGWMNADIATFVVSAQIRSPMNGGVLAYADRAAAQDAAGKYHGRMVDSLAELLASNGDVK